MVSFYSVKSKGDIGSGYEELEVEYADSNKVVIPSVGDHIYLNDAMREVVEVTISYNESQEDVGIEVYARPYDFTEEWQDD